MVTSNGSTLPARKLIRLAYFRAVARSNGDMALLQVEEVANGKYRVCQLVGGRAGPMVVSNWADELTEAGADAWFHRQVQWLCAACPGRPHRYEPVDVAPLEAPLRELRAQGADTVGVSVFLRIEAVPLPLILSLAEYVRLCPTADAACAARILSYQARATIESALQAGEVGDGPPSNPDAFALCFRALDQTGLADIGFLLGHRDSNHQLIRGFPADA